jgi:hypothetical protein
MTLICIPRSPNPGLPRKGPSPEMVRRSRLIGVGVGIGIGIDSDPESYDIHAGSG